MNNEPQRPDEHARLIAKMQESRPPPADAETPEIPGELLRRLEEQYQRPGLSLVEPGIPMELPEKHHTTESPSVTSRARRFFLSPKLAIAACIALIGLVVALLNSPESQDDLVRGGDPQPTNLPVYWLSQTLPAPTGIGMPTFIVSEAPSGNAIVCDPERKEARVLKDGNVTATLPITDPTDPDEWLTAHRQLSQSAKP